MKNATGRKFNIAKNFLALVTAVFVCSFSIISFAEDELPYDTYVYDYWGDIVYTPSAYNPGKVIGGENLRYKEEKIGSFNNPQDMYRAFDGKIYLADTGNNRIVVLDSELKEVIRVYDSFKKDGIEEHFDNPTGICVTADSRLYIADSVNRRIVILEVKTGKLLNIIENPHSEVLEDGYVFTPLKVSVDYAGRVYCIAQNMFEGIMVFENDGEFTGFFGTIEVKISLWDKFWKRIASKEERSKSILYIPTEFTGMDVDEDGFVYATNIDSEGVQGVRRLNPKGEDVINMGITGNLNGDLFIEGDTEYAGPSQITDVVYRENGIYSILDRKRGRVFTYDHEGNLLYVYGGIGSQAGTFQMPVAIENSENGMIVLDANRAAIICFDVTEYGQLINEAVALRYDGDETLAAPKWEAVLCYNENFELANSGLGKAYLSSGENELAMHYFKLAMNKEYYSIAFRRYRNEILKENLQYVLTGIAALVIVLIIISRIVKRKKEGK